MDRNHYGIYTNSSMPTYGNVFKNNIISNSVVWGLSRDVSKDKRQDDHFVNNNILGGRFRVRAFGANSISEAEQKLPLLWRGNVSVDPRFVDDGQRDLRLEAGSPMIDQGAFLTKTISSGSGTKIAVEDARYFMDGWGIGDGDLIQLEGGADTARIVHVDYEKNLLTVDKPLRWTKGQGVSLPYSGSAPDIGAYESTGLPARPHPLSRLAERHFRAALKAAFDVPPTPTSVGTAGTDRAQR